MLSTARIFYSHHYQPVKLFLKLLGINRVIMAWKLSIAKPLREAGNRPG